MDVCVIGAGIIGAATTFQLLRLGARVTLVDASDAPRGASAATFGWLNANGKQPDHYFELNRAGMEAHAQLARALGDDSWLHGGGSVEWAANEAGAAALRARVADLAARGYAAELVDHGGLRELEPSLRPDPIPAETAFFPSEGWVDTVRLVSRLVGAALEAGATVRRETRVAAVDHGRRASAIPDQGGRIEADVIVNCAGAEASALLAAVGLTIETAGSPGLNAVTAPAPVRINRVVRSPTAHFRPETGGRVMIAAPASDRALAGGADPNDLAAQNIRAAARHLPPLAGVAVAEARVARRAVPPDGLPMVGRLPGSQWLYHVVTHSGVTLAPLLGRLVAEEIVTGSEAAQLLPYRPARFVG